MATSNLFDVSGRVALITGASRGIGRAIAQGLTEVGASIALWARGRRLFPPTSRVWWRSRHSCAMFSTAWDRSISW